MYVNQYYSHTHYYNLLLSLQYTHPDQVTEKAPSGCYVSGLFLEGARWDLKEACLTKSLPKVLIEELPILRVIPIEAHRLKLVVSHHTLVIILFFTFNTMLYLLPYRIRYVLLCTPHLIVEMLWELDWYFRLILLQQSISHTGCFKVCVCYSTLTK